jgi:predicted nucleotidyltransferase
VTPEQIQEVWSMVDRDHLAAVARRGPAPVFASISGAHLYGFASADSDVDLRGAYLLPARALLALRPPDETLTVDDQSIVDLDWVAHELRKFARLLTNHNGYVLEQLYSPLVVVSTPEFEELRHLAQGCVTRPTVRHYQGFARGRRQRLHEPDATVKHLLYAYRVLLSGIHLMRSGEVDANLTSLDARFDLPHVGALVARKRAGTEAMRLAETEIQEHERHLDALEHLLIREHARSSLPESPQNVEALDDFVFRTRLAADGWDERPVRS